MTTEEMRELDAWIAENVFKLTRVFRRSDCNTGQFMVDHNGIVISGIDWLPFEPTTDPAAAMLVMEKCAEKLKQLGFNEDIHIQKEGNIWRVAAIYLGYFWDTDHEVEAETLPLAICLFAKALFKEDKDK